jgi:hypothetical protein
MAKHHYDATMRELFGECHYIPGHVVNGAERNPVWIATYKGEERYFMYCETMKVTSLCKGAYEKILQFERDNTSGRKLTFHAKTGTNYIKASNGLYLHQILMDWYGHGSGTVNLSVDHIDRNPLNNTLANLRIATGDEQRANTKGHLPNTKKDRQYQARALPEGITQEDMPKYVNYNVNRYGDNKEFAREFFRIENHPTLGDKIWSSTTKQSVSIHDKLQETLRALELLDQGILPERRERPLPHLVTTYMERGRPILAWQKAEGVHKLTKKITLECPFGECSEDQQVESIDRLNWEVIKKYGEAHRILDVTEEELEEIAEEKATELPKYTRTQMFADALYLVFNKDDHHGTRLSMSAKLGNNYNIHKELALLNARIVEKWGAAHAIDLTRFPYRARTVTLPENMYASLKCKRPYLLLVQGKETFTVTLPETYDLEEQIAYFAAMEDREKEPELSIDSQKVRFYESGRRPENISICFKDNKYYQLQYKVKTKEIRHDKTKSLPTAPFNLELELVKLNACIVDKYGEEYAILQQVVPL